MMKRGRDEIFTASSGSLFSIATFDDESGDANQRSNFTRQSLRAHVFHNRTGLIFESSPDHYDRYNRYHKERPLRIDSLQDYLLNQSPFDFSQRCILLSLDKDDETPTVDLDDSVSEDDDKTGFRLQETDFQRVHLHSYLERFKALELYCSRTCLASSTSTCQDRLDHEQEQYPSVYLTASSFSSAKQASTALCLLVSQVLSSRLQNGFAIVRPPGHHTEPSYTGGYCILNHVAIAASYALSHFSRTVQRILIVDWDVHHGNGTQRVFIDQRNVLYFSVHRYHGGNFFPFTTKRGWNGGGSGTTDDSSLNLSSGSSQVVGIREGLGFNINVGWEEKGMGDLEYMAVWQYLLMPVAKEYQPCLILVSAGFDSAEGDMGECNITPQCFGELTRQLLTLAEGKVICTLEGGYVRSVLQKCVEQVLCTLLEPVDMNAKAAEMESSDYISSLHSSLEAIHSSAAKSLCSTIRAHQPYWKCLQNYILPEDNGSAFCSACAS